MSRNSTHREHIKMIFLETSIYMAVQVISSKFKISQKAAILLALAEGCHSLGSLEDGDYKLLKKRYERPLKEIIEERRKGREPSHMPVLDQEKRKEQERLENADAALKGILREWPERSLEPQWREKVFAYAERYQDKLESARELLKKRSQAGAI